MPNSYKIKLPSFNQEGLKDVIQILETVFQKFDVSFYVIGTLAKVDKQKYSDRNGRSVSKVIILKRPCIRTKYT